MHNGPGLLDALLDGAYREALARFDKEVADGERDPAAEIAMYRRRRRDYASLLRIGHVPDEARELAGRLLETQDAKPASTREFEMNVGRLLVRLYEAFISRAEKYGEDSPHGSR